MNEHVVVDDVAMFDADCEDDARETIVVGDDVDVDTLDLDTAVSPFS